jgi:hypothetical protein
MIVKNMIRNEKPAPFSSAEQFLFVLWLEKE